MRYFLAKSRLAVSASVLQLPAPLGVTSRCIQSFQVLTLSALHQIWRDFFLWRPGSGTTNMKFLLII